MLKLQMPVSLFSGNVNGWDQFVDLRTEAMLNFITGTGSGNADWIHLAQGRTYERFL
jgi:hypothetical protein